MPAVSAAAMLVAAGLIGPAVGGCDKPADVAVRQQLDDAYAYRSAGQPDRKYVQSASKIAGETNGGNFPPATAALAQELLGDVSAESADATLGGSAMAANDPKLADGGLLDAQSLALALAGQANQLAEAIALGSTFITGQQAADPQPTLSLLAQKVDAVRTGDGWKPVPDVQATLASLSQTDAKIGSINDQISQLQSRNDTLDSKRSDLLRQASTLDEQSQQQGGRQGVQTYRQVSDLRNEASGLVAEQTTMAGQLMLAKQDLAEQQALKASLTDAVSALQKQQDTLQTAWQGVQGQIQTLRQANDATYAGKSSDGPSVESLGGQLADVVKRMEEQKREAVRLLGEADSAYSKAVGSAGKAVTAVGNEPDKAISKAIRDAFDTKRIVLKQAVAKRQLGDVQAASAKVYAALLRLQETLKAGGRDLPKALDVNPQEQYATAASAAAEAFDAANTQIANVTGSASGPLQAAAVTQQAVLLSAMTGLNNLIEALGIQVKSTLPAKADLQSQIQQVSDAAKTANVTLPPLNGFATQAPAGGAVGGTQGDANNAAEGPEEQAVRQALDKYLAAVVGGDAATAKSLAEVQPGAEGDDEVTYNLFYQAGRLRAALTEKFGAAADPVNASFDQQFAKLKPKQIVIRDDKAYFPQSDGPDDVMLQKVDGQWKMLFEPAKDEKGKAERRTLPQIADLFKQGADEVTAGQYDSIQAFQQAFAPRFGAIMGGGGPGDAGGGQGGAGEMR